jgi:hypothetical protein
MPGQKPVAKFRAGQILAAIWENEITTKYKKQVTMLKATVQRRYKDATKTAAARGSPLARSAEMRYHWLSMSCKKALSTWLRSGRRKMTAMTVRKKE